MGMDYVSPYTFSEMWHIESNMDGYNKCAQTVLLNVIKIIGPQGYKMDTSIQMFQYSSVSAETWCFKTHRQSHAVPICIRSHNVCHYIFSPRSTVLIVR